MFTDIKQSTIAVHDCQNISLQLTNHSESLNFGAIVYFFKSANELKITILLAEKVNDILYIIEEN